MFRTERSSLNPAKEPFVTVLIPAYNEEKTINRTMQSVWEIDYPRNKLQVIVINDGSKDSTEEKIKAFIEDKPNFQLLSQKNQGKAAALNNALKITYGEFFTCLDADSFVDKYTLKKMLSLYYKENDPKLAIITPAMKVYSPRNILQKIQWLEYIVIILIARISSHLDSLYVAPGPFSLYKTKIVNEAGGFDVTNITEDQEIAYRLQQKQYKIKHCFDGYVYTTAPDKIKPFYKQRRRWYLGSIICVHKYRNMIANKKYGDFGIMQMIKNVAGYVLALTGMLAAVYFLALPLLEKMRNLFLVKFDIIPFLKNFQFNFSVLDLLFSDFRKVFILIFLFAIGLFFFYQAHKNANEKVSKAGWIPIIPYFLFYYLLKGTILILSTFEFTRRRKLKW